MTLPTHWSQTDCHIRQPLIWYHLWNGMIIRIGYVGQDTTLNINQAYFTTSYPNSTISTKCNIWHLRNQIFCNAKHTVNKQKETILPRHVQLPNGRILQSTHEGNIQLATLPKEATKYHVFPHITYGALISAAQLCDHECISTSTNTNFTIHNKQMEPQIRRPWYSSIGIWTIYLIK